MKRKLNLILCFTLLITIFLPLSSVSAYTGGYANGKSVDAMIPDIYFIGRSHASTTSTTLITDNNEETSYLLPKDKMIMIDLGTDRTIDSYKLKGDLKPMRINFYNRSTGYEDAFEANVGDGNLKTLPKEKIVRNVRFITLYTMSGEDINISELDFFNSNDIVPAPEPSPTPDPKPTPEPTPTPNPTPSPEPNPSDPTEPTEPYEPSQPTGDRAILTVTMDNGFDKEFDLSKKELNAFIAWYDAKDAGRGPSFFAIDKHNNNKGPFSTRKDYVIFNKILTFEVSEYSTK
ncbi:hypothetical protein MMB75_05390 [Paenibacillus sp. P2(2022)]|uniref:hypothetical protein n=1 Tax=Paenibacillus TaxID=44249 RepID=UPI0002EFC5F4|nr:MULTISPECIES: hypothetical protein [Paenibacillus]MDG0053107.1 hypothetical protein [Paenibacillus sp. P2(2022)]